MRVVVAYDGGEAGERAVAAIASWVQTTDADVHMLTVLHPSDVHETSMPPGVHGFTPAATWTGEPLHVSEPIPVLAEDRTQAFESARNEAEERLQGIGQRSFGSVSLAVHAEVAENAAEAIVAEARRLGADVIAMGTHGRTGLRHALMGSVAEAVVRNSPIPVLIVGPGVTMPTPPA